jgi:hypothetical protein
MLRTVDVASGNVRFPDKIKNCCLGRSIMSEKPVRKVRVSNKPITGFSDNLSV